MDRGTHLFLQWSNDELLWLWGQTHHRSSRAKKRGVCFLMVMTRELARRLGKKENAKFLEYLLKEYDGMKEIKEL